MSNQPDALGMAGLLFFRSMSSSNFHEIKNALAIINENAGLIEDMVHMANEDSPIDHMRLKEVASKVGKQVKRADTIIKNINRFAHSVEKSEERIDLGETVKFVAKLSQKLAATKGITVKTELLSRHILITTSPFFLENLVWLCLDFAMGCTGDGKTVELITEETGEGGRIRLVRLDNLKKKETKDFISEKVSALSAALEADLSTDMKAGDLIISLPKKRAGE
ncbi:MAG: HAMP domain-containing histidine kinase [bacterium]|nr:HAMP domain-containing histidine kinase [bacterium]